MAKKIYLPLIAIGIVAICLGYMTLGIGLIIFGLIFRLESKLFIPKNSNKNNPHIGTPGSSKAVVQSTNADDSESYSPNEFSFNMTDSELESADGWNHITVYTSEHRYLRVFCAGGPPVGYDIWEFDVKEKELVFHRLVDDYSEDLYKTEYLVVNGQLQEDVISQKNKAYEHLVKDGKAPFTKAFGIPYSETDILALKQKTQWHELNGAIKYFLLSVVHPHGGWKHKVDQLQISFDEISKEAEALGATIDQYGDYKLSDDADGATRARLKSLFSEQTLLTKYKIDAPAEWYERSQILKLSAPSPSAN